MPIKYSYFEYSTIGGMQCRAIPVDGRVEIYERSVDLWDNVYWRFLLPISHEMFNSFEKTDFKTIEVNND